MTRQAAAEQEGERGAVDIFAAPTLAHYLVLGAILFFVVRLLVRTLAGDFIPASIMSNQQADQFSYVLVGIALMCLIIFRPQGILGNKKELSFSV